jgi:putative transcriptional regulator
MIINLDALKEANVFTLEVPDLEKMITGKFEKALREKLGLSQSGMAVMMHVTKKTIEKWEQGVNPIKGGAAVALYLINDDTSLMNKLYKTKNESFENKSKEPEKKNAYELQRVCDDQKSSSNSKDALIVYFDKAKTVCNRRTIEKCQAA